MPLLLAFAALAIVGNDAAAERFTLIKGAPKPASARAAITAALDSVGSDLDVCWVDAPSIVRVQITTDKQGKVTAASAHTKGGAAQCAAGILAVKRFPTAPGLNLTIDVTTVSGKAIKAQSIQAELSAHSQTLNACYDASAAKKAKRSGTASLRFRISADGSISDTSVVAKALSDRQLESCLRSAIEAVRLSKRADGKSVGYELGLQFDASASGSAASSGPGPTKADPSLAPEKKGPVSEAEIDEQMKAKRPSFSKCYERVAKRKPKLAGRVVLRYTIKADGGVTNVKIKETTLGNSEVEDCMVGVGNTLKFSTQAGRENTRVVYPFAFQPAP